MHEVISQTRTVLLHAAVVDDGSKSVSARETVAAGVVAVRHPINLGQGAVLQTGFLYVLEKTNTDYVVISDADDQHSVMDTVAMAAVVRTENLAAVLGSCFFEGSSPVGWFKRIVLRTATAASPHTSGARLTDAYNGLRMLRRDVLAQLDLRQNRVAYAGGVIRQTGATGMPWREFPVHIIYTDYPRAKGQSLWNSANILVDLLFS